MFCGLKLKSLTRLMKQDNMVPYSVQQRQQGNLQYSTMQKINTNSPPHWKESGANTTKLSSLECLWNVPQIWPGGENITPDSAWLSPSTPRSPQNSPNLGVRQTRRPRNPARRIYGFPNLWSVLSPYKVRQLTKGVGIIPPRGLLYNPLYNHLIIYTAY